MNSREMIAELLDELPPDAEVSPYMSGPRTAAEMAAEVRTGTELGCQFGSDLLRMARDVLARRARK